MILIDNGEEFEYEGIVYAIGDTVKCNEIADVYKGLIGVITEIRDGEDKDTDNTTPDIYCTFDVPDNPTFIRELEERFSDYYCEEKTIDDVCLDEIVMAPDMIDIVERKRE